LGMNVRDLDFDKQELFIRKSKSRKQRKAYLLDDIVPGILRYLEVRPAWEGPELWLGWNRAHTAAGGPLGKSGVHLMLARRSKRAGIRRVHAHLLRHSFAVLMTNAGMDIKALSVMMGHSTVRTTEKHYARWIEGPLRELHA